MFVGSDAKALNGYLMLYMVVQENLHQESQTENLWAKKKGNFDYWLCDSDWSRKSKIISIYIYTQF